MTVTSEQHQLAAQRLVDAAERGVPCDPILDLLPNGTVDDGYAVQQRVIEMTRTGARRVGRKIGLTSPVVQRQMGVDTPDFGVLFADMSCGDGEPVPRTRLLQPRVEAEMAFVLKSDLPDRPVVTSDVLRATDFVVAAIEIVDSRIKDWNISILDTVADNASSGMFVLGGSPRLLRDIDDLRACAMTIETDGAVVSSGNGAACLGSPINALVWLANAVAARGAPLQSGEVVLTGSLGALVTVERGKTYEASISGLGSVRATFAP